MNNRNTLLHIDSSIQGAGSVSKAVTDYLVEKLHSEHPELEEIYHNLGEHPLPEVTAKEQLIVYGSQQTDDPQAQQKLDRSNRLIDELMKTKTLVIGAPMYNFGIPVSLKAWIDHIARARVTFRYGENGPVGLTGIDEAYIVVSTGGTPVGSDYDFVSGYLKHMLNFIGVKNVHIIDATGKGSADKTIAAAKTKVNELFEALAA